MNTETIEALAGQLGVASTRLIEFYVKQIPALWIDLGVVFLIWMILILFLAVWIKNKNKILKAREDEGLFYALIGIGGFLLFFATVIFIGMLSSTYTATLAPEAYAISKILYLVR